MKNAVNAPPAKSIQFGIPPNIEAVNQSVAGGVALDDELLDELEPPAGGGGGAGGFAGGRTH